MPGDKKLAVSTEAPLTAYDFLTMGLVTQIDKTIHKALGKDGAELVVKDYSAVQRTYRFTDHGLVCNNCGNPIGSEDQIVCDNCGTGYQVILYIGV